MKRIIVFICLLNLQVCFAKDASASGHEGNGGDIVQAYFLNRGHQILSELWNSPAGRKFVGEIPLKFSDLAATLDFKKVIVTERELIDNQGHSVDAIGKLGTITLNRSRWVDYSVYGYDVTEIVFHEMLRSAGINDDNYVFSSRILPLSKFSDPHQVFTLSNYLDASSAFLWENNSGRVQAPVLAAINDDTSSVRIEMRALNCIQIQVPINNWSNRQLTVHRIRYDIEGAGPEGSVFVFNRSQAFTRVQATEFQPSGRFPIVNGLSSLTDMSGLTTFSSDSFVINVDLYPESPTSSVALKAVEIYFDIERY